MGKNNPRARKSQELSVGPSLVNLPREGSANVDAPAQDVAAGNEPAEREGAAGREGTTGRNAVAEHEGATGHDVAAEHDATPERNATLDRQALARQERIEREEAQERKRRRRRIIRRVVFGIIATLVLVFVALLAAFAIFRWQTYDDAADIQGTWHYEQTTVPVTITADEIVLTDEVAYRYVLDPEAKTILFRFGNMEGAGRYRFSLDRTELMIIDGEFDGVSTFIDDALWTAQSLIARYVFAQELPLATHDVQETLFTREGAEQAKGTSPA